MIRWLLEIIFFAAWISIFGTEQLTDNDPPLRGSRTSFLSPTISARVFNSDGRIVKDAVVWEGTEVTIMCKVHGFSKGTRLSWTEPSGETTIPTDHGIKLTMVLSRVAQSDYGQYICNAYDPELESGQYSSSVLLKVEATPSIRANNVTVLEGNRAVLRCTGTNAIQFYTISWLREGRELQSDANTEISGQTNLTFYRVNRRHSGTYECRITVGQVEISAYPQLTVVYPSEILEGPSNVTAEIGDTATFRCKVTGYPEPAVTWQLYGTAIDTSNAPAAQSKYHQSSANGMHVLTITDVQQEEDGGRYSCYVRNDIGMPLFVSAYLQVQGPPSPPKLNVDAIYGKGTAVFAALNWTEPDHDGGSPIIAYEPGCKRKGRDKFRATQVDSDVYSAEIPCAFIDRSNQTLPHLLHLLLRVVANNAIDSTSSESLDLTVEIRAAESNQSAFEVFVLPPTPLSTTSTVTATNQTYSSTGSPSISEKQHTPSFLATSDENSASGDSKVSTTEWWLPFTESEPPITRKASSPGFQFLPIATPNTTNFQDNRGDDSQANHIVIGSIAAMGFLVVLAAIIVISARKFVKTRTFMVELSSGPHHSESTKYTEEPFQADPLSETLNRSLNGSSPSINCTVCPSESISTVNTLESAHHSISLPLQEAEQLSESLNGTAHPDQHRRPATLILVESTDTGQSVTLPPEAEQSSESLNGSPHLDQGSRPVILVNNIVHPFSTELLEVTVGPEGRDFGLESCLLSVPEGAVRQEQQIRYQLLFGTEPTGISKDWFVFSPILVLEPHDFRFRVPVRLRFPFTATLEGWMMILRREEPEKGWKTVLTLDTDTRQVIQQDPHCNYDLNKRLLLLKHFCKYRWCGYRKRTASRSEKILACSLFARMDSSGNSCDFTLYLTDNCYDIFQEVEKMTRGNSEVSFDHKDFERIVIGTDGDLTIEFTAKGFQIEMESGKNSVVIAIKDLWMTYGIHKRILFEGKCVGRDDGSKDPHLHVQLSTSDRCGKMRAIFKGGESSVLQVSHNFRELAAQGEKDDMIDSSSVESIYLTESENSSCIDKLRPTAPSKLSPVWPEPDSGMASPVKETRKGTDVLRKHWKELTDVLDPELVIDDLFQKEVINHQELEEIRYGQGEQRRKKANKLLSKMQSRSDTAVRQFAETLSQTGTEKHKDIGERLLKGLEIAAVMPKPT